MTLRFGDKEHQGGPKLHALIIGVGHYPHLDDGSTPRPDLKALASLRSPPPSARALASWLIKANKKSKLDIPLGSVELLVSEIPDAGGGTRTGGRATASLQNIGRAYDDWFRRCDASEENVALFYFCGHGLKKQTTLLLPSDFGCLPNSPWTHALDFDAMCSSMASCAATTQYYVIDACRQWTQDMLQDLNVSGVRLGTADVWKQKPRTVAQLFGAASGLPAFGDGGGPSRLTKALIKCLEGGAAVKENGRWRVYVDQLGKAVKNLVERDNRKLPGQAGQVVDAVIGELSADPRVLIVLPEGAQPEVLVEFACQPKEATACGGFYYQGVSPRCSPRRARKPGPWTRKVPAGIYQLGVRFKSQTPYHDASLSHEILNPPVRPVTLKVDPAGS